MAGGALRHTGLIKTLGGALVIAAGIVPILVNFPHVSSGAGEDRTMAWTALGCGAAGVLMGLWILLARRAAGKPLVVTQRQWRYGAALVMTLLCTGLLVAALNTPPPQVLTGVPALLVASTVLQLFVPEGSEQDNVVALSDAQRRTWRRAIALMAAFGFLALCGAVALALSGNVFGAGFVLPFALLLLVFAVLMKREFSRRQNRTPQRG
ncbi:hypothetical protein KTU01_31340 [Kocuria turfanensis]|uniref:DUF1275 domain-containing protein n=1 Tax=Kocuria turfanensis TaxID=388357 RepID=A0A512IH37_9MICC|nr:hypothetical protein KTU01_31340 [Kocuria turfanensis]